MFHVEQSDKDTHHDQQQAHRNFRVKHRLSAAVCPAAHIGTPPIPMASSGIMIFFGEVSTVIATQHASSANNLFHCISNQYHGTVLEVLIFQQLQCDTTNPHLGKAKMRLSLTQRHELKGSEQKERDGRFDLFTRRGRGRLSLARLAFSSRSLIVCHNAQDTICCVHQVSPCHAPPSFAKRNCPMINCFLLSLSRTSHFFLFS